jgi:hypothetical protein
MVNVNHVGEKKVKQEQNIHHVDQHLANVKDRVKAKLGEKQNDKVKRYIS